ncbi:MAG: hypothetical protein U5K29_05745 [Acidimicrobiales bacterium]|nr:hypothetical protein [Acidimicrobiales bacterium]
MYGGTSKAGFTQTTVNAFKRLWNQDRADQRRIRSKVRRLAQRTWRRVVSRVGPRRSAKR